MKETPVRKGRPTREWDEGATAVEAAIALSLLFTLVFGIVEFGMALWQWNTMELAVLQAGRYVMVNNITCGTTCAQTQMQGVLASATAQCPLPSSPAAGSWYVCATANNAGTPPTMSLSANYGFDVIGFVGPFKVTAQATVPLD